MDNNEMNIRPDAVFASRLRWQLACELRRKSQFAVTRPGTWPLKAILTSAIALLAGIAVAAAAHSYRESGRVALLEAQEEAAVELARARLELAHSFMEELEDRERADPTLEETVLISQFELQQIEREVSRTELDLAEVRLSGRAPLDSLTAPLVEGRDFVSERLRLELEAGLAREELFLNEVSKLAGAERDEATLNQLAFELNSVRERVDQLRGRLELRRDFLAGELTARQVTLRSQWASIREQLQRAEARAELARQELARIRQAFHEGKADALELKQAQFQVLQAETEARLTRLEYDFLLRQIVEETA